MDINAYSQEYSTSYDFEKTLVHYRRKLVIEFLEQHASASVLEVGCGLESVYTSYSADTNSSDTRWTIIEPSKQFFDKVRHALPSRVHMENEFLENVKQCGLKTFDVIICAGLLHEVPDPSHFLNSLKKFMSRDTVVHLSVPNAGSLHRIIARDMGLIKELGELSERNLSLGQDIVFNMSSLNAIICENGFNVTNHGGFFLKPFSHAQMQEIDTILTPQLLDGLYEAGKSLPDMASEIFIEFKLDNDVDSD